jgi:hypothetical protein
MANFMQVLAMVMGELKLDQDHYRWYQQVARGAAQPPVHELWIELERVQVSYIFQYEPFQNDMHRDTAGCPFTMAF